ncbi:hypothetical protein PF004_g27901 [Phytophthora fragariae]|uniref:Uncharacterized protein n=2 Tax=Phytophthora fragariae TaxID=53985 RepID=A0A6A3E9W6_9STRA|nr:hypothetical protein PF009_g19583 [Phytophthora fragariae]KAE9170362.1 hypothetical protein PF004_g27901 [Phytophthora fragariae]
MPANVARTAVREAIAMKSFPPSNIVPRETEKYNAVSAVRPPHDYMGARGVERGSASCVYHSMLRSTDLFDLVYDSMLTTKGLAGATDNVTRRRQKREALQKVWLTQTEVCTRLLEAQMAGSQCQKSKLQVCDPFHVIQRLTEKISDQAQRGSLSKRLSKAIYDVERNIRSPSTTAEMFATAISSVPASSIRVSSSEWEGCVNSNLEQIRQGDLFVEESDYNEGGSTVRVVSTSQLEAIHSKLRKLLDRVLSIEVGLRILDVFLLQHNLKVGAKFKLNPEFDGFDFITLSRSAVLCRGTIPDSPQLEYFNVLLTTRLNSVSLQHKYRPGGGEGPAHRPWEALYDMIPLHAEQAEGNLL